MWCSELSAKDHQLCAESGVVTFGQKNHLKSTLTIDPKTTCVIKNWLRELSTKDHRVSRESGAVTFG
jgi:hypothetical protein